MRKEYKKYDLQIKLRKRELKIRKLYLKITEDEKSNNQTKLKDKWQEMYRVFI
jgi:hypothetical protein